MQSISQYSVTLVKEKESEYNLSGNFIHSPEHAVDVVNSLLHLSHRPNEHFVILTLTQKNEIAGVHTVHVGTLNESICHPREVFQRAILNNAASIICFHNHPSGDPKPSRPDIGITDRLAKAGELLGIEVLDHIIIGDGRYYSLKEEGHFPNLNL